MSVTVPAEWRLSARECQVGASIWTSVSLKATPPPQSVSVSLVRLLATLPSGCWWRHQPHGIAARPGRKRVEIRTGNSSVARSLNTRAQSPSASPRAAASAASSSTNGAALGGPVLGEVRVARVQEARVVLRCHELQRETGDVLAAGPFAGRDERRQCRVPLAREPGADELDLARLASGNRRLPMVGRRRGTAP